MIYAEAAGWAMHNGSLAVCDPSTTPGGLTLESLRAFYRERLAAIPIYRQRLVTVPAGLGRPVWVEDPDVDVNDHITEVKVPAPGGPEQLSAVVGKLFAERLDMSRPLWKLTLLSGLADGNVAVLNLVHHAVSDGVRGQQVAAAIFDLEADAPFRRAEGLAGVGTDQPQRLSLLAGAVVQGATTPLHLTRFGVDVARATGRVIRIRGRKPEPGTAKTGRAPWVRFNGRVGSKRSFAFHSLELSPLKAWAKAHGGTLNDAILTLTGGALRRYLLAHDELPTRPLLANIPVGHAPRADGGGGGNAFSVMIATLGTDIADPVERMESIARSTRAAKGMQGALGDDLMSDALNAVPAPVFSLFTKAYATLGLARWQPATANAVVSNTRGSKVPLYLAGARMVAHYPVGPVSDGLGLNLTLISNEDAIDVGITSSPALIDDLNEFVSALKTEVALLVL